MYCYSWARAYAPIQSHELNFVTWMIDSIRCFLFLSSSTSLLSFRLDLNLFKNTHLAARLCPVNLHHKQNRFLVYAIYFCIFLRHSLSFSLVAQGTLRKWETKRFTLYPIYRWNAKNKLSLSSGCTQNVLFTFENNHVDKNAPKKPFHTFDFGTVRRTHPLWPIGNGVCIYNSEMVCSHTFDFTVSIFGVLVSSSSHSRCVCVRIPTTTKSRRWW